MKIYKYEINWNGPTIMPRDAKVLSIQMQSGVLTAWAMVNPDETETQKRFYKVYGTGHECPDLDTGCYYCATVQAGPFVWHVLEQVK